MSLGIALSGGGVRGLVHAGVLQALEEQGIEPECVSGTSAGAIIGALYAHGYRPTEIREIARNKKLIRLLSLKIPSKGFASHKFLRRQLNKYLPEGSFDSLKKTLFVSVANLNTGEVESRSDGPLIDLVVASASIPVLFEPVEIGGCLYVDGGLLRNLPASPLKGLCEVILGVNVIPQLEMSTERLSSLINVGVRCFDLSALNTIKAELPLCDVVIEPAAIHQYGRFSFSQVDEMYKIGYEQALKQMDEIRRVIEEKGQKT